MRSRKKRSNLQRKRRHARRKGEKLQRRKTHTTKRTKVVRDSCGVIMVVGMCFFFYQQRKPKRLNPEAEEASEYLYNLNEFQSYQPKAVSESKRHVTSEERSFQELAKIVSNAQKGASLEASTESWPEKLNQKQIEMIKSPFFWQNIDNWLLNELQKDLTWEDVPLLLDWLCTEYTKIKNKEEMKAMLNDGGVREGKTLLYRLIEYADRFLLGKGYYLPMINVLFKHGADPNVKMKSVSKRAGKLYEYLAEQKKFMEEEVILD